MDQPVTRFGDWMQTYSGRQFWPMDPRAEEIDIEDIAHALSMQCRYAGHCLRFYSVAEHCVHLSRKVSTENALWALLHDASEAYLVDVPRPVKPYLTGYHRAEDFVMRAVAARFGLGPVMPAQVNEYDTRILNDEFAQNMAPPPSGLIDMGEPLGVELRFWPPEIAKLKFLNRFESLTA